jgi:hypothetical protein
VTWLAKVLCVTDAKPAGLGLHATAPGVALNEPAGQRWHARALAFMNVPDGQGAQADPPALETLPAGQPTHATAPEIGE